VLAYENLQIAIDSARVVYADGSGNEASALQNSINSAEDMSNNFDAELDDIYNGTSENVFSHPYLLSGKCHRNGTSRNDQILIM